MLKNVEDEQQKNVAVDKAKEKAKKAALKQGRKALKKGAKLAVKLALNVFASAMKMIIGFIISIGLPYILAIIGVIFAIFLVFIATTMIFGGDELDGDAGEIQTFIKETARSTVDMGKPEQVPYKVHEELIIAIMQLYESENTGKSTEEAIELIAEELKPIFEYTAKDGYVEIETTTCTTDDDGDTDCDTVYEKNEFTLNLLTHVTAWNGYMTAEVKPTTGPWESSTRHVGDDTTITVESRAHSWYTIVDFTEDYTHYETVLMGDPFNYGHEDLAMIEALYMTSGRTMNYTDMKQEDSLGDLGEYLDVIPGSNVPAEYMPYYLAAQQKYGVDWFYLAAIHFVETRFSTHPVMVSSAGAEGPMQFMRCTWHGWSYPGCEGSNGHVEMSKHDLYNPGVVARYGGYGIDADGNGEASPWDIKDAIFTTAYYLQKNGFKKDVSRAIWQYNHSEGYVNDVMQKAKEYKQSAYIGSGGLANSAGFIAPAKGRVTSKFGWRDLGYGPEFHEGIDIANVEKTPLYAVANGTVTYVENRCSKVGNLSNKCGWGWGNHVRILFQTVGGTYEAVYGHLYSVGVSKGQSVKQGQIIGLMGMSGRVTGPHLHIEFHKQRFTWNFDTVDPALLLPL